MEVLRVDCKYRAENFKGEIKNTSGSIVKIGNGEGELYPYDLLLGGLASCYYATFLGIVEKKHLMYREAEIVVKGEKREERPACLKWVELELKIYGAEDEKGFDQAADLAGKYCSIYETISKVAHMKTILSFEK